MEKDQWLKCQEYHSLLRHYNKLSDKALKNCRDNIRFPMNLFIKKDELVCPEYSYFEKMASNALTCADRLTTLNYSAGDYFEQMDPQEVKKRIKECDCFLYGYEK